MRGGASHEGIGSSSDQTRSVILQSRYIVLIDFSAEYREFVDICRRANSFLMSLFLVTFICVIADFQYLDKVYCLTLPSKNKCLRVREYNNLPRIQIRRPLTDRNINRK